jgi:hypothetical protein
LPSSCSWWKERRRRRRTREEKRGEREREYNHVLEAPTLFSFLLEHFDARKKMAVSEGMLLRQL